jgi:hypothetical protein
MNGTSKWVAALSLLLGSIAVNAQTATYAFTGVVTNSNWATLPIGRYVTGTYTFNYNTADTTIGIATWAIGSTGFPYNPVFASSVNIGGSTVYLSSPTGFAIDPDNSSVVTGNGNSLFSASESLPASDASSFFTVIETDLALGGPYIKFLPENLSAAQIGYGGFVLGNVIRLRYDITSLTLAPAPPPATLLATLLMSVTGAGLGDRLADKVERAQIDYAASNIQATCHVLAEFVQKVHRKDEKTIAPSLEVTLTRQAQAIAATIGCN